MKTERGNVEINNPKEVLINIKGLKFEYGVRTVFENLDLTLNSGEKLALAGPNGAGKTTLIKSVMGISLPDSGTISRKSGIRVAYVPQSSDDIKLDQSLSIENSILHVAGLFEIQKQLQGIYSQLEKNPSDEQSVRNLGVLQTAFENLGGYKIIPETKKILSGMGLTDIKFDQKFSILSGGEKTKIFIAQALASEPDVVILDEPTNHIDRPALEWLGNYLSTFKQSLVVVSHDPDFLDRFVQRVVEIVPEKSGVVEYSGNYSAFLEKKELEEGFLQRKIEKLNNQFEEAKRVGNKLRAGSRAGVGRGRLVRATKLEKDLEELSGQAAKGRKKMDINFRAENLGPRLALMISSIKVDFGGKNVDLSNLDLEIERGQRWVIDGNTGTGKSILLEIITKNIKQTEGEVLINEGVNIGYFSQKYEDLNVDNILIDEVRSVNGAISVERARSVLGHFLFSGDEQTKNIGVLSQGERSRIALAKLVVGGYNLLILDEPTNHLDIESRKKLIEALKNYNGTLIIVSQDRDFLNKVGMTNLLILPECKVSYY